MARTLARWISPLFILLSLLFIGLLLRSQWAELRSYEWRLHGGWFALASLLLLSSWAVEIEIWRRCLRVVEARLAYWTAVRIWFLSAVVRYVPGNIWQPLSMTLYCQRQGIRPEATLTSIMLFQAVVLLAIAPFAGLYMVWSDQHSRLTTLFSQSAPVFALLVMTPVVLFLARPGWMLGLLNWGLARVGRSPLRLSLSSLQLMGLVALAVFHWGLWGMAFTALAFALGAFDTSDMAKFAPHLIFAYPIGYGIGFLAFITPSGLGAREGAYYLLLTPLLEGAFVTAIALAMRIWTMIGEVTLAAAFYLSGVRSVEAGGAASGPLPLRDSPRELGFEPVEDTRVPDGPEITKLGRS